MALAGSSPSVDFVCHRAGREKRGSHGKRENESGVRTQEEERVRGRGGGKIKVSHTPTFEKHFAIETVLLAERSLRCVLHK